jgi:hypothetical protein
MCDHLWVLVDAFRRHRYHYIALHAQVGHAPPGGKNGVWRPTQRPIVRNVGTIRRPRMYTKWERCVHGGGLHYVGQQYNRMGTSVLNSSTGEIVLASKAMFAVPMADHDRPPPGDYQYRRREEA